MMSTKERHHYKTWEAKSSRSRDPRARHACWNVIIENCEQVISNSESRQKPAWWEDAVGRVVA